jgi:hypothetical protein
MRTDKMISSLAIMHLDGVRCIGRSGEITGNVIVILMYSPTFTWRKSRNHEDLKAIGSRPGFEPCTSRNLVTRAIKV